MEGDQLVGRILTCGWCQGLLVVCQGCEHGNRYCSDECSKSARRRSVRLAGARYQRSLKGKKRHAARTAAYRIRQREKVTHQSFPRNGSPEIVEQAAQEVSLPPTSKPEPHTPPHCNTCGRRCDFVVRRRPWPFLRPLIRRKQGEDYDSFQRDRSGDTAFVSS